MKIAFLFLLREAHNQPQWWERFLRDARGRSSLYLHVAGEFRGQGTFLEEGRRIPTQPTSWGDISLCRATNSLLAAAFDDRDNERFMLLSESCIPIKTFDKVAERLFAVDRTFLTSVAIGRKRLRLATWLSLLLPWRHGRAKKLLRAGKHTQWLCFDRSFASDVLDNPNFTGSHDGWSLPWEEATRYADEHYYTDLAVNHLGRSFHSVFHSGPLTMSVWRPTHGVPESYDHPHEFGVLTSTDRARLREAPHLFARKFLPSSDVISHYDEIMGGVSLS